MDRHPSNYSNTVRVLGPVVPFYDHATATAHHRHIAGGPGPGPGPGGGAVVYGQPILVATSHHHHHQQQHHQPTAYQLYHSRAFSTVNPSKMGKSAIIYQQHQQQQVTESKGATSTLNNWFTWKRKPKASAQSTTVTNGTAHRVHATSGQHTCHYHQQQQQHISEYCPGTGQSVSQTQVPPSLARLFMAPSSARSASVKGASKCLCSGLTESTFAAPTYYDEEETALSKQNRKSVDENGALAKMAGNKCKSKSKTLRAIKASKSGKGVIEVSASGGTLRSISTGSLLNAADSMPVSRPFSTLNLNRLNAAKSCDQLMANRKSILECDVNPYELVETRKGSKNSKNSSKVKCATVAVKSSRRSQSQATPASSVHYDSIECIEPGTREILHRSANGRAPLYSGIFNPANSIRIAGQSVYSSFNVNDESQLKLEEQTMTTTITTTIQQSRYKSSIDVNQQTPGHSIPSSQALHRSKSTASLSEWSFGSGEAAIRNGTSHIAVTPKVSNFHSVLIEPEPDYDMDDEEPVMSHQPIVMNTKSMDRLDLLATRIGNSTGDDTTDRKGHICNRRRRSISSVSRPKVSPPAPPELPGGGGGNIPLPPPPPPANYFNNSSPSGSPNTSPIQSLCVSTTSLSASLLSLKPATKSAGTTKAVPADSLSFQNELKEKLNQGVKSILKKTNTNGLNRPMTESAATASTDSDSSPSESASDSLESTDSCGSVENRIQAFEQSSSEASQAKPKKHVHFRMKSRGGMSRSRSTSHIITETIHEEDDEHNFYDDVAIPSSASATSLTTTRSFDDISIVTISSTSSITAVTAMSARRKESHPATDAEVTAGNGVSEHQIPRSRHPSNDEHPQSSDLYVDSLEHFTGRSHLGHSHPNLSSIDSGGCSAANQLAIPRLTTTTATCSLAAESTVYSSADQSSTGATLPQHADLLPQSANGADEEDKNVSGQSTLSRSKYSPRRSSKLANAHHFDVSSSPTPPPIPARRIIASTTTATGEFPGSSNDGESEDCEASSGKKSSLSRAVRSYSSGSVRSLLARKLNRTVSGGNSTRHSQLNGAKLSLSTLFSKTSNEVQREVDIRNTGVPNGDQVEEHIYEELDTVFSHGAQSSTHAQGSSSSFFGGRISRAEILDYLHDARGRLAEQEHAVSERLQAKIDGNLGGDNGEDDAQACVSTSTTAAIGTDLAELNADSGNSSFVDGIEYGETTAFIGGYGKSRTRKARGRSGSADQSPTSTTTRNSVLPPGNHALQSSTPLGCTVNRRNRVSNVSNSSSESSATSGVSGVSSNLSDDIEEDDMITNSSSSLGSMANEGSAGSASCYYGTCGSLGSGGVLVGATGSPQSSTILERNDSGVGADIVPVKCLLSKGKSLSSPDVQQASEGHGLPICVDCDLESMDSSDSASFHGAFPTHHLCQRCNKRRNERKEIISEIVDTELKYGRDLKIIQEQFAHPIGVAGLLTAQQVDDIFLNLDELIEVNEHFAEQLQDALESAFEQDDEDLTTVSIGQLFHDCLLARIPVFEQYCIRQGSASLTLNQLEKEKELLRIFLRVSQMENTLLRRMNLRSFLVVPVQRVTKYPLLLNRLHKVTSHHHPDRESLHEAQVKLEFHLESINQKTRGSIAATTSRIWRRISNLSSASIRSKAPASELFMDDFGYVRLKKTALEQLKWPKEATRFALMGKLSYIVEKAGTSSEQINLTSTYASQNNSNSASSVSIFNLSSSSNSGTSGTFSSSSFWSRTLKFSTANAILVTLSAADQETLSPSEPNSLTLFEQANFGVDGTEETARFNSASRRSNSKSPSRHGSTLAASKSSSSGSAGGIREAVLLLFKEKNGRYVLFRDTLNLAMCVIANATEVESDEFFEIHELESRESLLLKAETHSETKEWLEQLRQHSSGLGNWRKRRNALPNIMLQNVVDNEQHF